MFAPRQPHYVASRLFDGVDDPCRQRLALLPGYDVVEVPALPDPTAAAGVAPTGIGIGGGLVRRAERYAAACLRRLAHAPEGHRHRTCVAVCCRLIALAKAGLLDPVRVAAQIKGVMLGLGFDGRHGRDLGEIDQRFSNGPGNGRTGGIAACPMPDAPNVRSTSVDPAGPATTRCGEFMAAVERLARDARARVRAGAQGRGGALGVRVSVLDKAVKQARPKDADDGQAGRKIVLPTSSRGPIRSTARRC